MPLKRPLNWLFFGWLIAGIVALFFPHSPKNVILADPYTGAILVSLLISAAVTAGSIGLEYLIAKKQKVAPVDRGKQDDIRISLPGYGEQIIKAWGTFRTAPVWVWHKPIVHSTVVTQGHSGGKGPPKPPTPTTTDHIYTTSVAGVFHDGEIKNVTRIWFGADLVWNTTNLSGALYEAENATLAGGAASAASSIASMGYKVTGIGNGGTVTFSVIIATTGDYDVGIFYLDSTSTLSYEVMLDGVSQGMVSCAASGTNLIAIQTIGLTLTAGTRSIQFRNSAAACPDMDQIEVVSTLAFTGASLNDPRRFTELIDPTITPPTDQLRPWPFHDRRPIEIDPTGLPRTGTSTITANLAKWGQPQIRIYRGTTDQTADSAIIADKGVTNTPAWRGLAYLVIDSIQLPNGALPNVTIEVVQGTTAVNTIVTELYALGGITSGNLELSALSGLTITGVIRTSQKAIGDTLKDLQTRFQFDMIEVDGVVKAVLRNRATIDATIPYAKLRAHAAGSEVPAQDAIISDLDPLLLPFEVDVNYLDPAQDYHNGTQFDRRIDGIQYDTQSVSLALVDSATNLKKLASLLLYKPDMEGRSFQFETGPEFFNVIPGSVVSLQLPNATHTVRITDGKYQLPAGICQFTGVRQAPSVYSPTGFGTAGGVEAPIGGWPSNTKGVIIDGPLLRAEDAGDGTEPVVYVGMCGIGGGAWPGSFLYQENPIGSGSYKLVTTADKPSGIGLTSTTLATVSDPSVWDRTNSLTFSLYYDPGLSSTSEQNLLANPELNLLAVIKSATNEVEYVQYKTATPGTAASPFVAKYTVSTLLRGRVGTDNNVGVHDSPDRVVVIDSTIRPRRISLSDIGR